MELVLLWALFAIAGAAALSRYNKAGTGCALGLLLGPIGLVIALIMRGNERANEQTKQHQEQLAQLSRLAPQAAVDSQRRERECPFCAERILAKAVVCKHCGRDVEPLPEPIASPPPPVPETTNGMTDEEFQQKYEENRKWLLE